MPPFAVSWRVPPSPSHRLEARMPSGRTVAWIIGLSLLTYFGMERYKAAKGG